MKELESDSRPNGWALLPLALFLLLYVLTFVFTGNPGRMPVTVAFLLAS